MGSDWVTWTVVPAVTAFALGLAGKSVRGQAAVDVDREVGVMTYGVGLRRMFAGCAVACVAMMIMAASGWPITIEEDAGLVVILFAVLTIVAAGVMWEFRARVELSETRIVLFSSWRGRVEMNWEEVRDVSFRGGNFVLRAKGGKKLRVSGMLSGVETLIASFRQVLPRKVYTKSIGDYYELKKRSPMYGGGD